MPDRTSLHSQHVKLGARIVDFHGWLLPVQYEGILAEHKHCREKACVFDTGHMGQFSISGPTAAEELAKVCTQDAASLPVGRCQYGFLLSEQGAILDDTILMRLDVEDFLLVVNAGATKDDLKWVSSHLSDKVRLIHESPHGKGWGKLDLQGPASFDVLAPLVRKELRPLKYFHAMSALCCDQPCRISRTGYTGELGYEIFSDGEGIQEIFKTLLEHKDVKPAGLGARDMLRLEMCYPLSGQDISSRDNPIEADLGQFVDLKRSFVGAEALRRVAADGPARKLVAFRGNSRRKSATGQQILRDGEVVGTVASGGFSPCLGVSIGMGYVSSFDAAPGTHLAVRTDRDELPIEIALKPLYKKGTCRIKLS